MLNALDVLFLSDLSSKEAVFPMRSPRSKFSVTLEEFNPDDAFFDC